MTLDDTIAAISTPVGEGGLAVVRLSGPDAFAIADNCFRPLGPQARRPPDAPSHTVHYGRIFHQDRLADEVLLTVLHRPRTYTGEDTVEIGCHGGLLPARLVLEALLAHGARLAEAGEFTKRAFLNGRLDLAQAEAVADLIQARTESALAVAHRQLQGSLSRQIHRLRDDLLEVLAHVEAHIDFPEEDIDPDTHEQLLARIESAGRHLDRLIQLAPEGRILRNGIRTAIIGRANAGKSSLLNQLLGRDRAIVSPQPGTTRDTIEETANIRGLPIVFIDTAGFRPALDAIEEEGIRRSHAAIQEAELLLHVLDRSEPLDPEDDAFLNRFVSHPRLLVLNKADLPARLELPAPVASLALAVSCLTGDGLESLKDAICNQVWNGSVSAGRVEVMLNARHVDALRRANRSVGQTLEALRNSLTLELVAVDLRAALQALGEIVGQTATDDLLDVIFSRFCIGK